MKGTSRRVKVVVAVFVLFWAGLFIRAIQIQLVRWKYFEAEARKQHWDRVELNARRGRVFDRLGRALTLNHTSATVQVLPQHIRDKDAGKDTLAAILAKYGLGSRRGIRSKLRKYDHLFRLARGVDYSTAAELKDVLVDRQFHNCTLVDDENQRIYPYEEVCANVVGFIGTEQGRAGIEARFDSVLRGRQGSVLLQRDAVGHCLPYPSYPRTEPVEGADIRLTLDADIQSICYQAVKNRVRETGAVAGSAVVLDARTGAVLAIADFPSYDPAKRRRGDTLYFQSAAVCDEFEPGSSFKPVIGLAALESPLAGRLTARKYDASAGEIEVSHRKIKDAHKLGVMDFDGLFVQSSNVGCVMLSMSVGPEQFYLLARALGFDNRVGIELPGEAAGRIDPPEKLNRLRLANNAFGQGLTVTLLQLAAAYNCIANDGLYVKPFLVGSIEFRGRKLCRSERTEVRRAVKKEAAQRMRDILAKAVTEGTGELAAIEGVSVCGKTGTAQKVIPGVGYSQTASMMSFVGFFPKERPRYVVAVLLDEPSEFRFASAAACPVFREIGEGLLALERMRERRDFVAEMAGDMR
ncbi:MAG: penicillin-binding protein 2 [candidate division WOR-3 bacterium]|nr:MAG: penicillin-binding protein 2 [candidate division WOR-3 bacterium]